MLFPKTESTIAELKGAYIPAKRKDFLQPLIVFLQQKVNEKEPVLLNFICTHNSRRSVLAQVWAQSLAYRFKIPQFKSFSGGTEATEVFPKILDTLENDGFLVEQSSGGYNPKYLINYAQGAEKIEIFSKLFDHPVNPKKNFAAIMVCDHASENCPFVPGASQRLPLTYVDPKRSDGRPNQTETYLAASHLIANELTYVFSKIINP